MPADSHRILVRAMNLSLVAGLVLLVLKVWGAAATHSSAIYSDAAESVVHFFAVAFAAWSLRYSMKPADESHHYGHEKVGYLSTGFEGAMITLAAGFISYEAISQWVAGPQVKRVDLGLIITGTAIVVNLLVGLTLLRYGKRHDAMIVVANGKHVLTDVATSAGTLVGLILVHTTGRTFWDPLVALVCAVNIAVTGFKLMGMSLHGLLDSADPVAMEKTRTQLHEFCEKHGTSFHNLRLRHSGNSFWVEFHLVFPDEWPLVDAHHLATEMEARVMDLLGPSTQIISHLEPKSADLFDHVWETPPGLPARDERGREIPS